MANAFFRVMPGNFPVNREASHQRRVFAVRTGVDFTYRASNDGLRRCRGRRTRFKRINHAGASPAGSSLVLNIGIDMVEQAFTTQFC